MFNFKMVSYFLFLFRVKRRKRWINSTRELDHTPEVRDPAERRQSPRARRRIVGDRSRSGDSAPSDAEERTPEILEMRTSETESSDPSPRRTEEDQTLMTEDDQTPRTEDERRMNSLTSVLLRLEELEQKELEKMSKESVQAPLTYWDTSDEEAFSDTPSGDIQHAFDTFIQTCDSVIQNSNLNFSSKAVSETNLMQERTPTGRTPTGSTPTERKSSFQLDNCKPFLHSTPTRNLSYSGAGNLSYSGAGNLSYSGAGNLSYSGEGNLEVFSLDSLEITELDSFRSTRLILTGFYIYYLKC